MKDWLKTLFAYWQLWMMERGSYRMIERHLATGGTEEYLERFYLLKIFGRSLYLHRFWRSDLDGLHDHPWPWARIVLTGGYYEEGFDGKHTWCGPGHFVYRDAQTLHRVKLCESRAPGATWTLFAHGRRCRDWGFVDNEPWDYDLDGDLIHRPAHWISAEASGAYGPGGKTFKVQGVLFPRLVEVKAT